MTGGMGDLYFCLGVTQENDYSCESSTRWARDPPSEDSPTAQTQNSYCICFSRFPLSSSLFQKLLLIKRQKDSVSVEPVGEESPNSHGQLIKQRQLHKERERENWKTEKEADGETHRHSIDICTETRKWLLFVSQYPHVRRHKGDAQWLIERQRITIDSLRMFRAAQIHPSILFLQ